MKIANILRSASPFMMASPIFGALFFILAGAASSQEQEDCATTQISGATIEDLPGLIADAACFTRRGDLETSKARRRMDKALEIIGSAGNPLPDQPDDPEPEPEDTSQIPAIIPSNFDTALFYIDRGVTGTAAPDSVGAFRFICKPSHNLFDDPVIYPGQPGRSHLHTFFGNTKADAHSTYESLRTTGDSTCENMLNRSAYWIPAMMNGRGQVVMPNYITVYYKRRPDTDPECQRMGIACVDLPRGLRYVFGYNMFGENPDNLHFNFKCKGEGATSGSFANIPEAAPNCPTGSELGAVIEAPRCWDGVNLDSPDHRSHMAYPGYGSHGYLKCPDTHPFVIPTFTLGAWWTTDDTLDRTGNTDPMLQTWHFSSDRMAGMAPHTPGSTFHSDWFGAWDDEAMAMWTDHCINMLLNCSGGNLGNGKGMKRFAGFEWLANPRLVPVPANPLGGIQ